MKAIKISDSEWEVMNVLWENSPLSSSQIVETLQARRDWQPRTTRTLLERLLKKNAIRVKPNEKPLLYEPKVTMEHAIRQESQSFLERVFGGKPASMLMHLVGEADLSKEDIQKLKEILKKKEK